MSSSTTASDGLTDDRRREYTSLMSILPTVDKRSGRMFRDLLTLLTKPLHQLKWYRTTSPPKLTWEERVAAPHAENPIGYNGIPHINPQTAPSLSTISRLIHPSVDRPHLPPKQHPDSVSRFSTIHFPDRSTDRRGRRQTCTKSAYAHANMIVSDALATTSSSSSSSS